jgi:hypothetical protein
MFDRNPVDGPVLVLLAHNVEEAVIALSSHTEKASEYLQQIFVKFYTGEHFIGHGEGYAPCFYGSLLLRSFQKDSTQVQSHFWKYVTSDKL